MAKYFMASVGRGLLVGKVNGVEQVIANVDTLTESTLGITSTQEEVRAGQGAKLYGRFNHDAGMTVTLTDAMFNLNYIALQVGAEIKRGGIAMYNESVVVGTGGKVTLSKRPQAIGQSCGLDHVLVWYRKAGCGATDDYVSAQVTTETKTIDGQQVQVGAMEFTDASLTQGETVCVYYFTSEAKANTVLVNANFVPAELILVLTTKLFAGDASNPDTGKPVGEVTVKVPRFSLDGAFDLSMAMSSAATMSLNGTALAVDDGTCDGEGIYAEIVEVVNSRSEAEDIEGIQVEETELTTAEMTPGYQIVTYAIYKNEGYPSILDPSLLTYDVASTGAVIDAEGVVSTAPSTAGTITVKLTSDEEITSEITVTA